MWNSKVAQILRVDNWPENAAPLQGVVREAHYMYRVPSEEPTAVLTFSDAGETANEGLKGTRQILVELATLKDEDLDDNLAGIIEAVTAPKEAIEIAADQLLQYLGMGAAYAILCHPSVPTSILKLLEGRSLEGHLVRHGSFPMSDEHSATLIVCHDVPGLIAKSGESVGAFIFPDRFHKVHLTLASNSAWDRLMRGSSLLDDD